jgi:hypothetical protein
MFSWLICAFSTSSAETIEIPTLEPMLRDRL